MSGWTIVHLILWLVKCPVGQLSGWTIVHLILWLNKGPVGQLSGWINVWVGRSVGTSWDVGMLNRYYLACGHAQ